MGVARLKNQTRKHVVKAVRTRLGAPGRLPDFLLIGVPRGGTTACFRQLTRHPHVGPPLEKEIGFFDRCPPGGGGSPETRGERWYRSHFPTPPEMEAEGARITGESSPSHLFDPDVPERVRAMLPTARFIVLLRDPVVRAWSHWSPQRGPSSRATLVRERNRRETAFQGWGWGGDDP